VKDASIEALVGETAVIHQEIRHEPGAAMAGISRLIWLSSFNPQKGERTTNSYEISRKKHEQKT
jgi:hypothetical protein